MCWSESVTGGQYVPIHAVACGASLGTGILAPVPARRPGIRLAEETVADRARQCYAFSVPRKDNIAVAPIALSAAMGAGVGLVRILTFGARFLCGPRFAHAQ